MPRCKACDYCDTVEASSYHSGVHAPGYRKLFVIDENGDAYCSQCLNDDDPFNEEGEA